jgi:hypothetical protein
MYKRTKIYREMLCGITDWNLLRGRGKVNGGYSVVFFSCDTIVILSEIFGGFV